MTDQYHFDWDFIDYWDRSVAREILGAFRQPDLIIAPHGGDPYLLRWHVIPRNKLSGNIYFHVQLKSDPDRPLHDHPWDNTSIILSGGYNEVMALPGKPVQSFLRAKGDHIPRLAGTLHRLILPEDIRYTMTLFVTGPHKRDWGFYTTYGWVSHSEFVAREGNVSTMIGAIE